MSQPALQSSMLLDVPKAYWPMQELSGTTAMDVSGNGLNGTYEGGYTLDQSGPASGIKSVLFNGSSGYVNLPTISLSGSSGVTVESWFAANAYSGTPCLVHLSGQLSEVYLRIHNGGAGWFGYNDNSPNQGFIGMLDSVSASLGNIWHQVVGTFDGSTWKFYLDGSFFASKSSVALNGFNWNYGAFIGAANIGSQQFGGSICNVAVYTGALSATRILAHYRASVESLLLKRRRAAMRGTA